MAYLIAGAIWAGAGLLGDDLITAMWVRQFGDLDGAVGRAGRAVMVCLGPLNLAAAGVLYLCWKDRL